MKQPTPSLRFLPWVVLAVALGITWLSWRHERHTADRALQAQFDFSLRETVGEIEQRASAYEQILRGVQGLFGTTTLTDAQAFRNYMRILQLDANFSGIQSIGVIERIRDGDRNAHIAGMRRLGFANYRIHPAGKREEYAPIVQYAPHGGVGSDMLGFDPWSDATNRRAMEIARDSGAPTLTGKVQVPNSQGGYDPGFMIYLPLFAYGKPCDSEAQRREYLVGWVYATVRMRGFIASLYQGPDPGLILKIYDGVAPRESSLLYETGKARGTPSRASATLSATEYMMLGGHPWMLALRMGRDFHAPFNDAVMRVIGVTGVSLSIVLSLLVWYIVTGRSRALQLATKMTEELRHMAQRDPLTGLPNRALFSERVQQALAYCKRHGRGLAMIFIDLDNFKPVNDNHGHAVGDRVLQAMALRIQGAIRASDTVGRIGGDEFVVLMSDFSDVDGAVGLAEKIRHVVREPCLIDGLELRLSCSLGVAIYPDDGTDEISLTKVADEAMYRAKTLGRDEVVVARRA